MSYIYQGQIDACNSAISQNNAKIMENQKEIAILKEKIERLKDAKSNMKDLRSNVLEHRNAVERAHKETAEWKGTNQESFQEYVENMLITGYSLYRSNLSMTLDQIKGEISRLTSERLELEASNVLLRLDTGNLLGTIGHLMSLG